MRSLLRIFPLAIAVVGTATLAATPRAPVLVELYQSQGCSSCPPAEANLNAIAGSPGVIALSFAVTYWDQLGWKDTFAQSAFTARQWDYANRNGRGQVATPQIWVNGLATIVGDNRAQLDASIAQAAGAGPMLTLHDGTLSIAAGKAPTGGADIWVARYDPRTIQVAIHAGENGGKTLPHRNIVRQLVKTGHWSGAAQKVALPKATQPGLVDAAFLQAGRGGPVLSAVRG